MGELFKSAIRELLKKPVLEKKANGFDELPKELENYKNNMQFPTKLTPIQTSLESNVNYVYNNIGDKHETESQNLK